jgi:hypothetical protein
MSALVSKRGELHGQIDYHQNEIKKIKIDMESMDRAIKVFDPDYDLRKIKSRKTNGKNNFFEPREGNTLLLDVFRETARPISTGDLLDEVILRKGFDREVIDVKALRASLFVILKRLQTSGVVKELERDGLVIIWGLA